MRIAKECNLAEIVSELLNSKTVVFPTETSYGLGCDATNQEAVDRIFKIKVRRGDKPLLIVVPNVEMAKQYVVWNELLEKIAAKYWPGPLTIVGQYRRDPSPAFPIADKRVSSSPLLSRRGQEGWSRISGKRLLGVIRTKDARKELRQNKTKAEKILWYELRNSRLGGLRFRRQHGVGPFVADFYHSGSKTIVEIDGDIHFTEDEQVFKDHRRQKWLEERDYRVLRYNNVDIFNNLEGVLQDIFYHVTKRLNQLDETPPPTLPLKGEGARDPSPRPQRSACGSGRAYPPLERGGGLASGVVSKDNTIAVRVTAHLLLKSVTEKLQRPLVATSANIADAGDLYDSADVVKQFENKADQPDIVLNYGILPMRKPTTIVSVVHGEFKIIRQGEIIVEK